MRITELVDKLNNLRMKHGDIQVLSCPPDNKDCWTDDLNVDCYEDTKDRRGRRAVKIYGYV